MVIVDTDRDNFLTAKEALDYLNIIKRKIYRRIKKLEVLYEKEI